MTPGGSSPFHVMAKPTGPICNLACEYCFFLSKESLYPGDEFRMDDELLENYLRQLLESSGGGEAVVAWQGGEPTLMGLDFFRRSVELVEELRRPGQRVSYTIQTNGTRIDDRWAEFLKVHDFLVGLSVDGPRELHDAYRIDRQGAGSFDRVMEGWRALQAHDVDVNVLCAVHSANGGHPLDVYRFLRDEMGARYIQFIPIVERTTEALLPMANLGWGAGGGEARPLYLQAGDRATDRSVGAGQFGEFLAAVFDEWVVRDVGEVFVQHFDTALASWHGVPPGLCVFSETCGSAVVLEHNGDLYSCDHYVEPGYLLGNISEVPMADLAHSPEQMSFGEAKRETLPDLCVECEVRFACHGGCPKNRFIITPGGESGINYLCVGYKTFFNHIDRPMQIMSDLLRQRRPASGVMGILATEEDGGHSDRPVTSPPGI